MGVVASGFGVQGQAGHGMDTRGFRRLLGVFVRVSFGLGWGLRSEAGSSSRHDTTPSGRSVSYVYLCVMKSIPCMDRQGWGWRRGKRGLQEALCVLLGFSFSFIDAIVITSMIIMKDGVRFGLVRFCPVTWVRVLGGRCHSVWYWVAAHSTSVCDFVCYGGLCLEVLSMVDMCVLLALLWM